MSNKDVILINPSNKRQMYGGLSETLIGIEPPLWIGLLAGFLREQGFSVEIINADAQNFGAEETVQRILEQEPLLVGLGAIGANPSASSTPKMVGVRYILELLKQKRSYAKTFVWGIHPSALPEQTLRNESVDFVVRGEAFYPVLELLKQLKKDPSVEACCIKGLWSLEGSKVNDNGWADVVTNLDDLPFVAWDLLPMERYRAHNWHCFGHIQDRSPYAIIYTSLGCPFHCHYCNIHALYSGRPGIRFRSPQSVIAEIDHLVSTYQIKHLKILDELFVISDDRTSAICDLLIDRDYDLNIWAYARVDTVSEKILKKLKRAGIHWLCYGIEAGSRDVRQGVDKGRFDQATVRRAIQMTHEAQISVIGNFMFGLPDDTLSSMQETLALAQELKCEYVNFYTTMAYPGSLLYQEALDQGWELPGSWNGFSQFSPETLPLPTKHLSASYVLRFRDEAFQTYYPDPDYVKMILEKFGKETVDHIQQMLSYRIERKILSKECKGAV